MRAKGASPKMGDLCPASLGVATANWALAVAASVCLDRQQNQDFCGR